MNSLESVVAVRVNSNNNTLDVQIFSNQPDRKIATNSLSSLFEVTLKLSNDVEFENKE
jgi:hypothetical protein